MAKRIGDVFVPATAADLEAMENIKQGKAIRIELTRVSGRAINNHNLYFGGLVRLVSDYWDSEAGLISKYDRKVFGSLIEWVAARGKNTLALSELINLYLQGRAQVIKSHLPEHEKAGARANAIHQWLKEEAGYYDVVLTPTGVRKEVKSINFNAMPSEAEFKEFYRRVFAVAWKYVFSKTTSAARQRRSL